MMHVENLTSTRSGREVPNQFRISGEGKTVFQSYSSMIATIDHNAHAILIGEDWDYSKTTGKYRNQFFEEMGFRGLASKAGLQKAMTEGSYDGFSVKAV